MSIVFTGGINFLPAQILTWLLKQTAGREVMKNVDSRVVSQAVNRETQWINKENASEVLGAKKNCEKEEIPIDHLGSCRV